LVGAGSEVLKKGRPSEAQVIKLKNNYKPLLIPLGKRWDQSTDQSTEILADVGYVYLAHATIKEDRDGLAVLVLSDKKYVFRTFIKKIDFVFFYYWVA
jgi:hypothetical protein